MRQIACSEPATISRVGLRWACPHTRCRSRLVSCTVGILRDPENFIFRNADLQRVVFHTELSFRSLYSQPPLGRLLVEVAGRPARRAIRLEIEKTLWLGLFIRPGERIHGAAGAGAQWNPSRPCPFPRDVWRRGIQA